MVKLKFILKKSINLNLKTEVYNEAYRNNMILRAGTRYAPVWAATDCFQKNVYALCSRGTLFSDSIERP